MKMSRFLINNLFVIVLFTLLNTKKTVQLPISKSEVKTITANKGGDVSIPCVIDGDQGQAKIWYKVGDQYINEWL